MKLTPKTLVFRTRAQLYTAEVGDCVLPEAHCVKLITFADNSATLSRGSYTSPATALLSTLLSKKYFRATVYKGICLKSKRSIFMPERKEQSEMPCSHFTITITQRSKRQSAVAGAAYQSGEPLFSEYDQDRKSYSEKKGIAYTEIMLPTNAPPEYSDRATLWNSAEAVEKQWNSQLARRIVLALPREIPTEQYPQMLRDFCNEQFVSKGMCVDFAIHNKNDGNPHAHIMLTLRGIEDNGKWLPKSRKVYDLDKNGERIKLPSGNWKSHKENTVDWNDQQYAEIWRRGWETVTNEYLEIANRPERVDLRSFERQGITDQAPTVHIGAAVTQMERRGVETIIGSLNRDIKNANNLIRSVQKVIGSLRDWLSELFEKRKQIENVGKSLPELLLQYMDERKVDRSEWSAYGKQSGSIGDLKKVSSAICYLQNHNITSLETLDSLLQTANSKLASIRNDLKASERRMKELTNILGAFKTIESLSPLHDKYVKIGWKTVKENLFLLPIRSIRPKR